MSGPVTMTLSSLLARLDPDAAVFIIHYLGPHEYEAVFEGVAREARSNGVEKNCGENSVLSITPELNDIDEPTIPVLVIKIGGKEV